MTARGLYEHQPRLVLVHALLAVCHDLPEPARGAQERLAWTLAILDYVRRTGPTAPPGRR